VNPGSTDRRLLGIGLKSFCLNYIEKGIVAEVRFDAKDAEFKNWCAPEATFRWSCGAEMGLSLNNVGNVAPGATCSYRLTLPLAVGEQTTRVSINGALLGIWKVGPAGADISKTAPCSLLHGGENTVMVQVSKPTKPTSLNPASHDDRLLGVAFSDLTVEYADKADAGR
jgi:hypothetical protein